MSKKNKELKEVKKQTQQKTFAELKNEIKKLVDEYNCLPDPDGIGGGVGCIFSNENEDYDYDSGFFYKGWMPSSLGC